MRVTGRKERSPEEQYDRAVRQAEKLIRERMPGKTIRDAEEIYRRFYTELTELRRNPDTTIPEIIACLDRYADVLEIADLFPEPGRDSWADYRKGLAYLSDME